MFLLRLVMDKSRSKQELISSGNLLNRFHEYDTGHRCTLHCRKHMHKVHCESLGAVLPKPMIAVKLITPDFVWADTASIHHDKDKDNDQCSQNDQVGEEAFESSALLEEDEACAESLACLVAVDVILWMHFVKLRDVVVPLQEVVLVVQDQEQEVGQVEEPVLKLKNPRILIIIARMVLFSSRPNDDHSQIEYVDRDEE